VSTQVEFTRLASLNSDAVPALFAAVCLGVFGGLSPLVATWLIKRTGDEIAAAFLSAAVSLLTVFWFRETARIPFGGAASGGAMA
jgi:hypothetical protein